MAVTLGATTILNSASTAGPVSTNVPASTVSGDLLVAYVMTQSGTSNVTVTPPSGFTQIGASTQSSGWTSNNILSAYYKVATGSEGATVDWSFSAASKSYITITRLSGQNLTTTPNVYSLLTNNSGSTTASGTAITPTKAGCVLLMGIGTESATQAVSAYAVANNNPTWTEQADSNDGVGQSFALATGLYTVTTTTGAPTATLGSSSKNIVGLVAIAPGDDVNVTVPAILPYVAFLFQFPFVASILSYTVSLFSASKSIWTPKSKNSSSWTDTTKI